jgi:hypothetical protein
MARSKWWGVRSTHRWVKGKEKLQELLNLTIFKNKVVWRNLKLPNLVSQFEVFKSIHLINMAKISKQIGVMRKICDWFKCMNWGKVIHTICHYFSYFTIREANDRLWIHICIVWVSKNLRHSMQALGWKLDYGRA